MNEGIHATEWLVSTLEGDTGAGGLMAPGNELISGVYNEVIPSDVDLPAIRLSMQAANDARGIGSARVLTTVDWLVVVTTEGLSMTAAVPIADRIDEVLHEKQGETSTVVVACTRLEPFQLLELEESGLRYRHTGGLYRTIVYEKP